MLAKKDEELWQTYKKTRNSDVREKLILNYAPMVKHIAGRLYSVLPPHIDFDDLISFGVFGLIEAIENYQPERGIKFETYAYSRIKGAIIDQIRKNDWVPLSIRRKYKLLNEKYRFLEQKLGRAPTDSEMSKELGLTIEEYLEMLKQTSVENIISFEDMIYENNSILDIKQNQNDLPENFLENSEIKKILADAINKLPSKEKMVITLFYYEGLTFKEISIVMNLSISRVSQLHSKALLRMRGALSRKKDQLVY
ncbi:MAG: polymerase sigma factor FliA [Thermosediminibacterales bacterium]|nr:polymerase sigma factor FliA [Thermosediminibacterales bacterium]